MLTVWDVKKWTEERLQTNGVAEAAPICAREIIALVACAPSKANVRSHLRTERIPLIDQKHYNT